MVLQAGEILEFDTPESLLANPSSLFSSLAKKGGIDQKLPQQAQTQLK